MSALSVFKCIHPRVGLRGFLISALSVLLLLGSVLGAPAQAQILNPRQVFASNETCPGDFGGKPKFNCTANDIDLTLVTTQGGPAECDAGEMVTATFNISLSANANIRYNPMIWISQNVVDPRASGAGGQCFVSSVPDDDTTHIPQLLFADANVCADIDVPSNNFLLNGLEFGSIEFECADTDSNGYADVPILVTWDNQGGDACSAETGPGAGDGVYPINSTPAKCDQDVVNTNIEIKLPDLQLDKTTTTANFIAVGDTIDYDYEVTNSGDKTLECPIVIDDDKATVTCPNDCDDDDTTTNLEPDESVTCTASYNVIQADLDQGFVQNFATARTRTLDTKPVYSNEDTVTVNRFIEQTMAIFRIHKIWDQGGDQDALDAIEVTGHLSCTGANKTQQKVLFTATTDAILFVYDLDQIPEDAQVNCKVWETVPDNYTADYDCDDIDCGDSDQDLDHCAYLDITEDEYVCVITNTPDPAVVTVTKTWVIEGADQGFDGSHSIRAECGGSQVYGGVGSDSSCGGQCAEYDEDDASSGSKDYEFTILKPKYPYSGCSFGESTPDSAVESDNGCAGLNEVSAGDDLECEIVNTVFFEGIPTLNQHGMAVLALLMLGVGLVGFRRLI